MKKYALQFLGALLLFCSCSEGDDIVDVTNCSDNPLESITWLKELVDNEMSTDDTSGLEIIQYTYKNSTVFSVNDCINNCSDAMTVVYDCDKNVLCEFGGIAGVNTCPGFDTEALFVSVLYSSRITDGNCDKGVIISKDLYDSSTASPIQEISIEGNCMHITFSLLSTQDPIMDVMLIDSGVVWESNPTQRKLKFVIVESSTKPTSVNVTTSFDISTLATWDAPKAILNLENYTEQISYTRNPICGDPNVSCVAFQDEDAKKLEFMLDEIQAIASSVVCENSEAWKITAVGSKACGGPQSYLAYATTINETDFLAKVEAYRVAEENYNKRWGIFSTCDVPAMPSSITCIAGKAEFVYNN